MRGHESRDRVAVDRLPYPKIATMDSDPSILPTESERMSKRNRSGTQREVAHVSERLRTDCSMLHFRKWLLPDDPFRIPLRSSRHSNGRHFRCQE